MDDDERLIELAANAWHENPGRQERYFASCRIRALQEAGIKLIPPPDTEKTYRITESQWKQISWALSSARRNIHPRMNNDDAANIHDTWLLVAGLSPEEE